MQKLIKYHETELIANLKKGMFAQDRYYKMGLRKFRIRFENSNGTYLGFNSDMCASMFDPSTSQWKNLHEIKELRLKSTCPSYYSKETLSFMKTYFAEMKKFLEKIYG